MFKKRIMFFILLILSFGILTSCNEVEYYELGLDDIESVETGSCPSNPYFQPLKLGLRSRNEYKDTINVELYYGMSKSASDSIRIDFNKEQFKKYSDYNQIVSFNINRYLYLAQDNSNLSLLDKVEVFSIAVKLGDFLATDDYLYTYNNKAVDKIDYNYVSEYSKDGEIQITYEAEISAINDDYISYIYCDLNDETSIGSTIYPEKDYREIKSIHSSKLPSRIIFSDEKFKLTVIN